MKHTHNRPPTPDEQKAVNDMATGFGRFVDEVLRGRENKTILNSSMALATLEAGVPKALAADHVGVPPFNTIFDIPRMIINNIEVGMPKTWGSGLFEGTHRLFDFSAESFTLFGLDFNDMWAQFGGVASKHSTPIYEESVATSLGLPNLPYGELAHCAHLGMALYDTGRTFQDLWNEPALKHNVLKIMTHPEMGHTLAHRAVMLTVMGLLHPLGPVVAIGVAYMCAHLVHSAFGVLERNKDAVREIENVPVLRHIYNATGIKEWAEAKGSDIPDTGSIADIELEEPSPKPSNEVQSGQYDARYRDIVHIDRSVSSAY